MQRTYREVYFFNQNLISSELEQLLVNMYSLAFQLEGFKWYLMNSGKKKKRLILISWLILILKKRNIFSKKIQIYYHHIINTFYLYTCKTP
jgi:hypothetical protein